MKSHDKITMSIAQAVEQVFENNSDFVDLHSIDVNKRRGSEPLTEKDIDEANEFTKAAAKAAVAGDKDFKFDGKTYPTEMDVDVAKKILGESTSVDLEEAIDFSKVNDDQLKGWLKVFKKHTGNPWSGFKDDVKRAEKEAKKRGLEESVDLEESLASKKIDKITNMLDSLEIALRPKGNLNRLVNKELEGNYDNDFKIIVDYITAASAKWEDAVVYDQQNSVDFKESVDLEEATLSQGIKTTAKQIHSLEKSLKVGSNLNKGVNKLLEGKYDADFKEMEKGIDNITQVWEEIERDFSEFGWKI